MLCRAHHRQVQFTEWIVRMRDGLPEFIPPSFVDRRRTPRRKALPQLVDVVE
jgi:5-methylcytosine-specific restriction protein A